MCLRFRMTWRWSRSWNRRLAPLRLVPLRRWVSQIQPKQCQQQYSVKQLTRLQLAATLTKQQWQTLMRWSMHSHSRRCPLSSGCTGRGRSLATRPAWSNSGLDQLLGPRLALCLPWYCSALWSAASTTGETSWLGWSGSAKRAARLSSGQSRRGLSPPLWSTDSRSLFGSTTFILPWIQVALYCSERLWYSAAKETSVGFCSWLGHLQPGSSTGSADC